LRSYGVAVGALDRIEVSAAADQFDATGTALNGIGVAQHIYGLKVRVYGDAVYDQDSWVPQTGTDWYANATKVFLTQSLLVNATIRCTKSNGFGLLGVQERTRDANRV
jgi:hypothetical protein